MVFLLHYVYSTVGLSASCTVESARHVDAIVVQPDAFHRGGPGTAARSAIGRPRWLGHRREALVAGMLCVRVPPEILVLVEQPGVLAALSRPRTGFKSGHRAQHGRGRTAEYVNRTSGQ